MPKSQTPAYPSATMRWREKRRPGGSNILVRDLELELKVYIHYPPESGRMAKDVLGRANSVGTTCSPLYPASHRRYKSRCRSRTICGIALPHMRSPRTYTARRGGKEERTSRDKIAARRHHHAPCNAGLYQKKMQEARTLAPHPFILLYDHTSSCRRGKGTVSGVFATDAGEGIE